MWDLRADTTGRIMVGLVACRRVLGRSLALMRRATWVRELARVRGRAGVRELALLRWLAPRRGLGLAEGSALLGGVALTRGPAPVRDLALPRWLAPRRGLGPTRGLALADGPALLGAVALTRGLALADGPALLGGPPLTRGPALTYRLAPVRDLARMRQAARVAELKAARAVVPVLGSALRRGRAVAQELLLLGLAVAFGVASSAMGADATPETKAAGAVAKLTLTSPQITQGKTIAAEQVFNGFGCTGMNVSPALSWSGAPAGTKSFAVMVHDPDAPTGSGFWHWVVYDIPADTKSLPADAGDPSKKLMPAGAVQARTDFGTPGYGGPCPPPGKPHHYHFRLYALKVSKLAVPPDATAALIGFNVNANKLAEADLVGLYGR